MLRRQQNLPSDCTSGRLSGDPRGGWWGDDPGQLLATVPEGDVATMFAKLDTNGDGKLTVEEAEGHPDPGMVDSFADGDDNDDGVLDLAEFTKLEVTDE